MDVQQVKRRLLEQDELAKKAIKGNLIKRDIFEKQKKTIETQLIKAIIGPRRSGKTTLGFQLISGTEFYYVNFDDEILAGLKKEELGLLLEALNELFGKRTCIFLDEIQNIDGWELFANRLHRLGYNVLISGSNSHLLSKELSTHLGGRVISIYVLPFSFKEYLSTKGAKEFNETDENVGLIKNHLANHIHQGGFPEILLKIPDELKSSYFNELYNTILLRDIAQRYNVRHSSEMVSLANILLNTFSSRQSALKLSKILGLSSNSVNKYISYFEESYLLFPCRKFSFKPKEMESSFKKYYFIDTGLIMSKKSTTTADFGRLIENIVAIELKRRGFELYYYLSDGKLEADFVLIKNGKVQEVIQVSDDNNELPKREISSGLGVCKELRCKKLTIITWNSQMKQKEGSIHVEKIPLWRYLMQDYLN